ncbi:hypothetical protein B1790_09770 [Mycobacterium sp. AT1]|nr:hypothetical protein B1790_09770 [Mycobacterium sp. AT1]
MTTRQERGRSAVEARREVRKIVDPELTKVRQYRAHAMASVGREDEGIHSGDLTFCGRVLTASRDLGWWRRRWVHRRLQKLFGSNTVHLCEVHGQDADDPGMAMAVMLQRQAMQLMHPDRHLPQPDTGEFDLALRHPPGSDDVARLVRSLERLASCR